MVSLRDAFCLLATLFFGDSVAPYRLKMLDSLLVDLEFFIFLLLLRFLWLFLLLIDEDGRLPDDTRGTGMSMCPLSWSELLLPFKWGVLPFYSGYSWPSLLSICSMLCKSGVSRNSCFWFSLPFLEADIRFDDNRSLKFYD